MCSSNKSQETKFMSPENPPMHMLPVTSSRNKKTKVKLQEDDRNCQENRKPKKPKTHMRSVTNIDSMWLPTPVTRRLCKRQILSVYKMLQEATKV